MLSSVVACGSDSDTDVGRMTNDFATAIAEQNAEAASEFTTSPAQAAESLQATFSGMDAKKVETTVREPVEYSDGTASFVMKTTYSWPGQGTYETNTSGIARNLSSGWRIQWAPALIYEGMPAGARLQKVRTDATPAPAVNSRTGKTFMKMVPVNTITFDPAAAGKKTDAAISSLSDAIKPIAPLVTSKVIRSKIDDANGQPITAVKLRESDMKDLNADPEKISGVTVERNGQLVMEDRRLSTPLSKSISNYWTAIRDATAGWQVQLEIPGSRPQRLAGKQGPPGKDIATSVDQNEQLVLENTVVEVAQPANVMVLDASSGGILALAQNESAAKRDIEAGVGYATGSTLDPVFGAIDRATKDKNDGDKSANDMLYRFGLGVRFSAPGVSLPRETKKPSISTANFTPSNYTSTMMNMGALGVALARAADGKNQAVAPYVIKGAKTKVTKGELGSFEPPVARDVLDQMATIARTGDASDLTKAPGLRALVGTNGPQGPGWFVGLQGGKVIVVYCEGEKSGTAALQVAQKYFTVSAAD
ncbi:NTF2-like N-terminal transpeptidase domain-containing protein [Gordonia zhaorongruii]|uniref:NTF2-like N-terminal transpeptidase domain-containing protein n=1 Tax=Gordonia zhaorongruii TaxID=2597659 RepID=UPI001F4467FB|nr:NTF2-like N-terminal transpeptidase domain-containing protein [Gordonia zhaorongruii]